MEGFSLFEAVKACAPVLTRFGGHPMAAGLSVEPGENPGVPADDQRVRPKTSTRLCRCRRLTLDCRLRPAAVTEELPALLEELEPFGAGFPAPLFGLFGMTLQGIVPVGGGKHLRLLLSKDGVTLSCMRFGVSKEALGFREGDKVDAAVSLSRHEFRGQMSLTTQIMDLRPAGLDTEDLWRQRQQYEALCRGEPPGRGKIHPPPGTGRLCYPLPLTAGRGRLAQQPGNDCGQGAAAGVAGGENGAVFDLTMHVRRTQGTGPYPVPVRYGAHGFMPGKGESGFDGFAVLTRLG